MNPSPRETITQLTPSGIRNLLDDQQKNVVIVQVIDSSVIVSNKGETKSLKYKFIFSDLKLIPYRVTISDGFASQKGVFGNEAAQTFEQAGAPNFSVIRVVEHMMTAQAKK